MTDDRRRFNRRERAALYLAADGRCVECGVELDVGWHSDHVTPHSRGGATHLINGQALCPPCNLRKGNRMSEYVDTFTPRPFQTEVVEAVANNHAAGTRVTVVLAAPGSGKTLASQAAACNLLREGAIDVVLVLVPRVNLARQYETKWRVARVAEPRPDVATDWCGDHELFDVRGRIAAFEHTENRTPLLPRGPRGRGIVTTYASLVSAAGEDAFEHFVQTYAGRFLLVADEAQFCGEETDAGGGTRAGAMVKRLHESAAHTLLMTGTPERSDGKPLILAEYGDVNDEGIRPLLHDVRAVYSDGIRDGYLREFEATLTDARITEKVVGSTAETTYDLSDGTRFLRQVLRRDDVWKAVVDRVVTSVRDKQQIHPEYRGLIACMEQREARAVHAYLSERHPSVRTVIATSDDGMEAKRRLDAFREGPFDILITVRMAYIGYDCERITVVGVLTNYRDRGHLLQLTGRGLRMWKDAGGPQTCRIIAPDDPGIVDFIDFLQEEMDLGIRERADVTRDLGESGDAPQEPTVTVTAAVPTGWRAVSAETALDAEEFARIDRAASAVGSGEDRTRLAEFMRLMSVTPSDPPAPVENPDPVTPVTPMTTAERIAEYNRQTHEAVRQIMTRDGIYPDDPGYRDALMSLTVEINSKAGGNAAKAKTNEHIARMRRDVALKILAETS